MVRHLLESVEPAHWLKECGATRWLDFGSGAGLPAIPLALLFFNVGVELGQLLFIAAMLGFIAAVRRVRFPVPGWATLVPPYAIGSVAMFWVVQRVAAF